MKTLIIIGGFLWLGFFVFHALFWRLFDWKSDLESLTATNKAVMQVLNLCLMIVMVLFSYVSIFQAEALLTTSLGKSILIGIISFGVFRSIFQAIFFDLKQSRSKLVLFVALLGTTIYLIPLISLF